MALALRISVPFAASHRHTLGEGVVFPRCTRLNNLRYTSSHGIRCSGADAGKISDEGAAPEKGATPSPSWPQTEPAGEIDFAGWTPLEIESKSNNKLAGAAKIVAGLVLAVGFAAVTYTAYARKGTKHAAVHSVTTRQKDQVQLPSTNSKDGSEDVQEFSDFDTFSLPSSTGKEEEETQEGNPVAVVDSESDLQQKKTSPAAQATPGNIVVPATVDHEQEQALAALQSLKVIEPGVEAGGLCSRREYARWLIASTSTLVRSPAHKVFPAMYVENSTELAFNDVSPEDPDFPYIQGLAEAGLISSNLSRRDTNEDSRSTDGAIFLPDSPVSRQDLVSWRLALEKHNYGSIDKEILKNQLGFIDIDRISEDALPFLAADLSAGERSIVATAFGFTRRFQPDKPVTRAQAAIALVAGEAADAVAEELTRLEAEHMADTAVVAELALEARARKEVDEFYGNELKLEREERLAAARQLEEVKEELKKITQEREDEKLSFEKAKVALESERELLMKFRGDVDEQLQLLTTQRVEVGMEKEKLESLRREAEAEKDRYTHVRNELEVEKRALELARLWAEEEAKKARAHAKILEEARKRWEDQGIEVHVEKELDAENIPALSWQYGSPKTSPNQFNHQAFLQYSLTKAKDLKDRVVERFFEALEAAGRVSFTIQHKVAESLHGAGTKVRAIQQDAFAAGSKTAKGVQEAAKSTASGLSVTISEGTKKIADGCRGEAEKIAQKFKSS